MPGIVFDPSFDESVVKDLLVTDFGPDYTPSDSGSNFGLGDVGDFLNPINNVDSLLEGNIGDALNPIAQLENTTGADLSAFNPAEHVTKLAEGGYEIVRHTTDPSTYTDFNLTDELAWLEQPEILGFGTPPIMYESIAETLNWMKDQGISAEQIAESITDPVVPGSTIPGFGGGSTGTPSSGGRSSGGVGSLKGTSLSRRASAAGGTIVRDEDEDDIFPITPTLETSTGEETPTQFSSISNLNNGGDFRGPGVSPGRIAEDERRLF